MKIGFIFLPIAIVAGLASECWAQEVSIILKTGEKLETMVTASSSSALFTKKGTFQFIDIDSLDIHEKPEKYKSLIGKLNASGIKSSALGTEQDFKGPIDGGYFNFYFEDAKVVWKVVYQEANPEIINAIKNSKRLSLVSQDTNRFIIDVKDFVYHSKSGYTCSGRAIIDIKPGKYRVTFKDISFKPGAAAVMTYGLGGIPNLEFYANDFYNTNANQFRKGNKNIQLMDTAFKELFQFKQINKTDDW